MSEAEVKTSLVRFQITCQQLQSDLAEAEVQNAQLMDSIAHAQNFSEEQALSLELLAIDLDQHKDALVETINKLHKQNDALTFALSENDVLRKEVASLKHRLVILSFGGRPSSDAAWSAIRNSANGVKRKLSNIS